ncbi:MAG TPA: hypothetical protein VKP11_10920 [Frankiaceae bacterium]|nr:hypothetical protein [Frankiaceae bacterium]
MTGRVHDVPPPAPPAQPGPAEPAGPGAGSPGAVALHRVRLLRFPLRVHLRAQEQHAELMREFALLAIGPPAPTPGHDVPARLVRLVEAFGHGFAGVSGVIHAAREAVLARGERSVDLAFDVPAEAADASRELMAMLAEAGGFCRRDQLLTLAADDELVAFRTWYLGEIVRQVRGAPPVPWAGTLD